MSSTLLEVKDVSKAYPGAAQPALQRVSLTVTPGQLVAVAGESGSGKTTLLRIIAGLEEPDAGTVTLKGKRVEGPSEKLIAGHPDIKVVFQDFRLAPSLSVVENIQYALRHYDLAYQEERVAAMLQLAHLEHLQHHLPRMLSGGEQQRVSLARALADEPALLLMDEPFSNLDHLIRRTLRQEVQDMLNQLSCGIILVSHDPEDSLSMADQVVLLRQGTVEQQATPRKLYNHPATPYAAHFFGTATIMPVNQLIERCASTPDGKQVAGQLQSFRGRLACIRGEHIVPVPLSAAPLQGYVQQIRFLGAVDEVIIQLQPGDQSLTMHTLPGTVATGQRIGLSVAVERLHFFSTKS